MHADKVAAHAAQTLLKTMQAPRFAFKVTLLNVEGSYARHDVQTSSIHSLL